MPPVKRKSSVQDEETIRIGVWYLVKREGEWCEAVVLSRKYNRTNKTFQYYVHYQGMDQETDEWVTPDRIEEIIDHSLTEDQPQPRKPSVFYRKPSVPDAEKYRFQKRVCFCEYCLKYVCLLKEFCHHKGFCTAQGPPGELIYKHNDIHLYEIDPLDSREYCQNLSLLTQLYIEHKAVVQDVDKFLFYVLCESDEDGVHIRGYFSKEKRSAYGYNVACLLVLPPYQRQGFGKLLIGLSYELSKIERSPGSPAKPLNDLGKLCYLKYWTWVILDKLKAFERLVPIKVLIRETGMTHSDIVYTLNFLKLIKYWENSDTARLTLAVNKLECSGLIKKPRLCVQPNTVRWAPKYL